MIIPADQLREDEESLMFCPECGRFSRHTVIRENENTFLLKEKHVCPFCGKEYEKAMTEPGEAHKEALESYLQAPGAYNASVRRFYHAKEEPQEVLSPADEKIEKWKQELLDTGQRNRLVNYRESRSGTLKITEPSSQELFEALAVKEKELSFRRPVTKLSDYRTYAVLALMDTLSCPLPVETGDISAAGTVSEREKTLKNLQAKTKLAREEQGINVLYMVFGFILWRDPARGNGKWIKSPLLMMPVSLNHKKINDPYTVRKADDETAVNPTLSYIFETEHNITLPPFVMKGKDSCRDYFREVSERIDAKGWKVTDEVCLGLFSFLKIGMYHDLEQNTERIKAHPVLKAMFGDRSGLKQITPEITEYDFDKSDPAQWHEVVDADSSQQEAILLFRKGISFVMQGPPGTGKSQTITNIIAEALAQGKKVLFVSEKAAALEVVRNRLSEAGLDDFCLSLHDYKADKKKIVREIEKNLRMKPEQAESYIDRDLKDLRLQRQALDTYAGQLHDPAEPLGESIYSVFGRLSALKDNTDLPFRTDNILSVSADEYSSLLAAAEGYENALKRIPGRLTEQPWYGTSLKTAGQAVRQELTGQWGSLPEELRELQSEAEAVQKQYQLSFSHDFDHLQKELSEALTVLSLPVYPAMSAKKRSALVTKAEKNMIRHTALREASAKLQACLRDTEENWHTDKLRLDEKQLGSVKQTLEDPDHPVHTAPELKKEEERLHQIQKSLQNITEACEGTTRILKCPEVKTGEDILRTARLLHILSSSPSPEEIWFHPSYAQEALKQADEVQQKAEEIRNMEENLHQDWDPGILNIDAERMLARFRSEYTGMFYMLKADYRADMKLLKVYYRNSGTSLSDAEALQVLEYIHAVNLKKWWFEENRQRLSRLFGRYEDGMKTDLNRVRQGIQAVRDITALYPAGSIPSEMISAISLSDENISGAAALHQYGETLTAQKAEELFERIRTIRDCDPENMLLREEMIPLVSGESERLILCRGAMQVIRRAILSPENLYEKTVRLISDAEEMRGQIRENGGTVPEKIPEILSAARDLLEKQKEELAALQPQDFAEYAFLQEDEPVTWQYLTHTLKKIRFYEQSSLPDIYGTLRKKISGDPALHEEILMKLDSLIHRQKKCGEMLESFQQIFPQENFRKQDLSAAAQKAEACLRDFDGLDRWLDVRDAEKTCENLGMGDFVSQVRLRDNTIPDVRAAFEKGFAVQWLAEACGERNAVRDFRRLVFDQKAEKFRRLDRKQLIYSRRRIREKVISSFPDRNNITAEIALLNHEAEKKKRIMPLRRLFREIPELLLQLKPCLMMSPLSVAYFLNADDYHFDTVIFDEASQIFPQDAVGAILRADQVIIAGDTKQLPPTDFFSRNALPQETEDEFLYEETFDSILEEASSVLPGRMLLWHYRSRNEDLISFSNRHIYHNELITFPSSGISGTDDGVEFVYIEDGYYEAGGRSRNLPEALRCVELMKEHIGKYPERSLGIIAFSEKQQQAIQREVQRFREKNPAYEWFFAEDREETFFVKNLETVQGDERDTIFFSIGYARTKEQKKNGRMMSMNFGPLTQSGGERRLNVAITRARINIKLISSILPSDFREDNLSEGVEMLREYIRFAMNGPAARLKDGRVKQDDFADSVCRYLNERGYETERNAGCSGYRIDIAVKHPVLENVYAAAVECDGYNYISGRTVRDRDRLRGSVLQAMGWHLYRVWSAEWFRNEDGEGRRLTDFIDKAAEDCLQKAAERKGEDNGGRNIDQSDD